MATARIPVDQKPPVFVIVPGASQNAAHYGYLPWLLQRAGYPVFSSTLPSLGNPGVDATAEADAVYVRKAMLEPILDVEGHNVVLVMHSYGGMPGSAACQGLGRAERKAKGKSSSVLGQIFIVSILPRGGDGTDLMSFFGGSFPPHIYADENANLLRCDDPIPPLYADIDPALAKVMSQGAMCHGLTTFHTPCPRATWDDPNFKGHIAYIRTLRDAGVPLAAQQGMINATGQEWIVEDVDSGHCPQLSVPDKLCDILVSLAEKFATI